MNTIPGFHMIAFSIFYAIIGVMNFIITIEKKERNKPIKIKDITMSTLWLIILIFYFLKLFCKLILQPVFKFISKNS